MRGAPPPSRHVVIERVTRETEEKDLWDYVGARGVEVRSLMSLSHSQSRYQKFKLEISKCDLDKVYDAAFWPCGIGIRRYYAPRNDNGQHELRLATVTQTIECDGAVAGAVAQHDVHISDDDDETLIKQW